MPPVLLKPSCPVQSITSFVQYNISLFRLVWGFDRWTFLKQHILASAKLTDKLLVWRPRLRENGEKNYQHGVYPQLGHLLCVSNQVRCEEDTQARCELAFVDCVSAIGNMLLQYQISLPQINVKDHLETVYFQSYITMRSQIRSSNSLICSLQALQ